jgi:hypothetical protein
MRGVSMEQERDTQRAEAPEERSSEERYQEFFPGYPSRQPDGERQSLEQPSPLRVVPSVTTHGAYEEPI